MTSTYDVLFQRCSEAFGHIEVGADPVLRVSDRSDFQANGAMALGKKLGENPRAVAERVVAGLDLDGIASVEIAGPGFINITLTPSFVSTQLHALALDDRLAIPVAEQPKRVVIDYSAPNVAKEMHVGHLRSTVIGDALARMHTFAGHTVIARNHVGDWGTPFGMLIEHLLDLGENEAMAELSIGDLDGFYKGAREKFEADDAFKERSRLRVVMLQSGDEETRRLWHILVEQSVAYFSLVYAKLDVLLRPEDVVGESYYNDMLEDVVSDLRTLGLLVDSNGAWCVFPEGFATRDGDPLPVIVQKRDEGFGYSATDLAAIRDRVSNVQADEILYVVGTPQSQHFEMIYAVARMAKWLPDSVRAEHVAFGNVLGPDRKMFKSRAGGTVKLVALLDEAIARAEEVLNERTHALSADEVHTLAGAIGRAAIKYADLSTDRQRDYIFDIDRMVSFEGDTGPYLQYAHARISSIFRRSGTEWTPDDATYAFAEPAARHLAMGLMEFPEVFAGAMEYFAPHRLCTYLFDLAQRFTSFYDACPVLQAVGTVRDERLTLCALTQRTLAVGLSMLGIQAPTQM